MPVAVATSVLVVGVAIDVHALEGDNHRSLRHSWSEAADSFETRWASVVADVGRQSLDRLETVLLRYAVSAHRPAGHGQARRRSLPTSRRS